MNEKIQELFEQVADNLDPEDCMVSEEFLEKFAELIIEECAEFARQHNLEKADRSHMIHRAIKEHFGVEVEALRQALAQPEQEPVAYYFTNSSNKRGVSLHKETEEWQPLYTAPPKREWVGLIAPEIHECYDLNPARFASNIEAKLKEKNT